MGAELSGLGGEAHLRAVSFLSGLNADTSAAAGLSTGWTWRQAVLLGAPFFGGWREFCGVRAVEASGGGVGSCWLGCLSGVVRDVRLRRLGRSGDFFSSLPLAGRVVATVYVDLLTSLLTNLLLLRGLMCGFVWVWVECAVA